MQVLKFGGSSVGSATRISAVLDIVAAAASREPVILVSSAIKGCTDTLLKMAGQRDRSVLLEELRGAHHDIITRLFTGVERRSALEVCDSLFEELSECEPDLCQTYGELFSTRIIASKLACDGLQTMWVDSRDIIDKDDLPGTYARIGALVAAHPQVQVFVAPGFIARDSQGRVTTLGRGGSDYSAAIYAAGCGAAELQIWTDVPGIMTANPKDVSTARTIPHMSYQAALDMARFGAKVLYAPTVQPAMEKGITIVIKNSFDPANPGTVIGAAGPGGGAAEGASAAALGLASQAAPAGDDGVKGDGATWRVRIALVGGDCGENSMARVLSTLRQDGISVAESRCEEGNLFVTVAAIDEKAALRALHREYFEGRATTDIDLYIAGFGAVGKALLELIGSSRERLAARIGKTVRVCGISDSRSYVIDQRGLALSGVVAKHIAGAFPDSHKPAAGGRFVDAVIATASRGSVFVDVTNSEDLFRSYDRLFAAGISVVTSNRRSLAVPYAQFAAMKAAAREAGVSFRYETTVGASLPMLSALSRSVNASDEILSIEAVVSCSMNLLLGGLSGRRFSDVLYEAFLSGLTESDPRIDLGGVDVLRKLLILGREAGIPLEAQDVEVVPMLPPEYFDIPLDEFFSLLQEKEPQFDEGQRFVGEIVRDPSAALGYRARIALKTVDPSHPAFRIRGTDNVILIRSAFHPTPLVIEGEGEGPRGAAASVLDDVL